MAYTLKNHIPWKQKLAGWLVHAFTASGAFLGLLSMLSIYEHRLIPAFWLMGAAVVIDAVDGCMARMINIKEAVPTISGELLDNIVDFVNYTIVPCFFILVTSIVPPHWRIACVLMITFSSAYQFTQVDAKTHDHFFKGFPSYWNIVIFYMFFWQLHPVANLVTLLALALLSFVPIKYIYPSRLEFLTHSQTLRIMMLIATIIFGIATGGLIWVYPHSNLILNCISMSYMTLYAIISLYRTWFPLASMDELDSQDKTLAQYS